MRPLNPVFAGLPTTIFTVMSALAVQYRAINLGQGFPDRDGPEEIRAVAAEALLGGPNQYPPMAGVPELRQAIAAHARAHYGLGYDPDGEVLVTSGGTEALTAAILGLAGPGDEVVLIEPAYDSYRPIAETAGAKVRTLTLQPPHWRLTQEAVKAAITPGTKLVMVNSPLNPAGRVFDQKELALLADAIVKADALAICDEVYEHLTFDGKRHVPLASLPGMRERCLRAGSAGKIFSLTGWKVGWLTGDRPLVEAAAKAHQFLTFTTPPALQLGVAHGLSHCMDFPAALAQRLEANRDLLARGLCELGFDVLPSEGTYFLGAGITGLTQEKDRAFAERLVREAGVAAVPLSVFFAGGQPDTYLRFALCKEVALIEEALARLKRYLHA